VGYQDFRWGMSRKTVESILKKQKIEIKSSDADEIVIQSRIGLDGYPSSVEIDKGFVFLNNVLGRVQLRYRNAIVPYNISKLYAQFRNQLEKKYGKCDRDSTAHDEKITIGFSTWKFKSGDIIVNFFELPESSEFKSDAVVRTLECILVFYDRKHFDEDLKRERVKKTSREF
jgi:hypothetical protein